MQFGKKYVILSLSEKFFPRIYPNFQEFDRCKGRIYHAKRIDL